MKKFLYILILILISFLNSRAGWFQQSSGVSVDLHSVDHNHGNENIAWICGDNGIILYTSNGGSSWVQQNSGTTNNLFAIIFMEVTGGPVYACGENGIILRTSNNGTNWSVIPSNVTHALRDISDFNFVAVGDSGTILKSTNMGFNWSIISSPTQKNLYAVSAVFSSYIVGENGTILRGFSGGTNWSAIASGVTNDLFGVPLFGNSDIAVGEGGLILRSSNIGANWYAQNSMTQKNINSTEYSVNNTSRIYCVGDSGLILKTTDGGSQWWFQNSGTSKDLNSVFFYLDDNTGYAVGDNGTILKTTDGGGVMTAVGSPSEIINEYTLKQNYPNPFNPSTNIDYELPVSGFVSVKVFDILGNEIISLVDQKQNAGIYSVEFSGSEFASGVYFYKLEVDGSVIDTKRMLLLK